MTIEFDTLGINTLSHFNTGKVNMDQLPKILLFLLFGQIETIKFLQCYAEKTKQNTMKNNWIFGIQIPSTLAHKPKTLHDYTHPNSKADWLK